MKFLPLVLMLAASAAAQPAPRNVDVAAPDGAGLKATYFAADRPGPAVLLLHMCITTPAWWAPVDEQFKAGFRKAAEEKIAKLKGSK